MIEGLNGRDLFAALLPRRRDTADAGSGASSLATAPTSERERRDTITLSEGGHKIVNLNRAKELGDELRAEKDPDAFRDKLRRALEDIRRIGRLFHEVASSLFRRRPPGA